MAVLVAAVMGVAKWWQVVAVETGECGDEEDDVGLAGGAVGRSMTSPPSWAR